jgi:putative polyhydroxyalkanoate system protein
MASISITRKHDLPHRKAKEVADKIAKDLQKRFELAYTWDGDDVEFRRPGVTGKMHVAKDKLLLDVTLGFLLTPLKPIIENEIHAQLDKLLGAKTAAKDRPA